jgi:hypothetical protein
MKVKFVVDFGEYCAGEIVWLAEGDFLSACLETGAVVDAESASLSGSETAGWDDAPLSEEAEGAE